MSIFSSSNTFRKQYPEEKTVLVVRKHWCTLLFPMAILLLLTLLPFIIYFFVSLTSWYYLFFSVYWFLVSVYFLILWNLAFYNIIMYYLDTIVITNKRVIENEQNGLFKYTASEVGLGKIQDISVKVFGPLAEFLGFGDMEIQSAGTQTKFYFHKVPHPYKIRKTITDLRHKISKSHPQKIKT